MAAVLGQEMSHREVLEVKVTPKVEVEAEVTGSLSGCLRYISARFMLSRAAS